MTDRDSLILQAAGLNLTDDTISSGVAAVLSPPLIENETGVTANPPQDADYLELRRRIRQAGLLDKQPLYYTVKVFLGVVLLAIGVAILVLVDSLWVQMANAAFIGFAFSQVSFIGHDAGHYQIARSPQRNEMVGLLATFLVAMDLSWWIDKHNRHHANPNLLEQDDDIEVSVLAFTEEQALSKNVLLRPIVKYQAFFFFPILMLSSISLRFGGVYYIIRGGGVKYPVLEPLLMATHALIYFALLVYLLGPWQGALFLLVHQSVAGLFMGGTFAPNHKGMPVLEPGSKLDFLRHQVSTSRNVRPHPITDLVYGGLNYQIEHHLFPSMPRNNLRKARIIVKDFCGEKSIGYHETSVIGSNVEILKYLHQVSRPLRTKRVST